MYGRPALNCAVAGFEGNDLVIIDFCSGKVNIIPRITSPAGKGPLITWIGSQYTVSRCSYAATYTAHLPRHIAFVLYGLSSHCVYNCNAQVTFPSGASFTAQCVGYYAGGYYMNVYATAPGIDRGSTVGLCGKIISLQPRVESNNAVLYYIVSLLMCLCVCFLLINCPLISNSIFR